MAGKDLITNVVIGGKTTAGFNALAGRLETLGSTVDRIGSYVREFEKDSVKVYRSYEDNMLAAQYALSAQYDSASELSKVMSDLDKHASEWAGSTIFHTDDVSQAINEAAHAGWDYTKIIQGIPKAMLIAQAGSLDLSTGLDYLVKMMNATDTEFSDISTVVDQWSKAANLSATDIGEMGDAFMSLGSAAQFADSTQELFTMLAVLANVGTTGSQAGTALRGAMMRLVAPTTKAEAAMSLLGASSEEINEVLADTNVTNAAKTLEGLGFSAYDAEGNLLPMIDIFTGLHDSLKDLDEQSRYEILSAIFPLRNIAAANAFYKSIEKGNMAELFTSIGDSEGYAAEGADIMMSGMTGSIETLKSKWEEFERTVGKTLAPVIQDVADGLGGIVDAINGMDETQMSALVGAMTSLATVGPGLMAAGGAIRLFATLGPWGTAFVMAATGAGALVGYLTKLDEINFESSFGQMELDLDALGSHVDSLQSKFDAQQGAIAEWESALEAAEQAYATKSSQLSELLLTDVLTGKELTDADKDAIDKYVTDLYTTVTTAISNAESSNFGFLEALFSDAEAGSEEEAVYNTASQVLGGYFESVYGEAEAASQELRNKMTEALRDGNLNEAEREAIQASIDRYNQIMAQIASAQSSQAYYEQLYKAQTVSWDTASAFVEENATKMEEDLAANHAAFAQKYSVWAAAYEWARDNNEKFFTVDGVKRKVTDFDEEALARQVQREEEESAASIRSKYGEASMTMVDSLMAGSEYGDAWRLLRKAGINEDGTFNLDSMFTGLNSDELSAANSALAKLDQNWYSLIKRFPGGFFDTEQGEIAGGLIQQAGNAARTADEWRSSLELTGWDVVPTRGRDTLQAQEALTEAEARLAALQSRQAEVDAEIAEREGRLERNQGDTWSWWYTYAGGKDNDESALNGYTSVFGDVPGLYATQGNLTGEITDAQAEVAALQADLDALQAPDVQVDVDTSAWDSWTPQPKSGKVIPFMTGKAYSEGGRAVEASIFGEDGPEWAIPEEHSERTAALLDEARKASGFSWGELLSRYGGLNANPGGSGVVLNYSPTINATSADGVAGALEADKERLRRMLENLMDEQRTRDAVEAYA